MLRALSITLSFFLVATAFAQDTKPILKRLSAFPAKLTLKGADDCPQLAITAERDTGRARSADFTGPGYTVMTRTPSGARSARAISDAIARPAFAAP